MASNKLSFSAQKKLLTPQSNFVLEFMHRKISGFNRRLQMNANLKSELIEVFAKQVATSVRFHFENITKIFGADAKGVANSRHYRVWSETVRPCCDRTGNRVTDAYTLSEERLARFANSLASDMADEVLAKVDAKVGELTNPNVIRVSGANFIIIGTKSDRAVRIEQNQIINVSSKGKLFNQYPSRIYVDGKFTPATKFAAI